MLGPFPQRPAALIEIQRLVVNRGDTGLENADVPQGRLDDMREHAEALVQRGRELAR